MGLLAIGKKQEPRWEYEMIDGNWTKHPDAYCWYYKGYLTAKMMKTHKCKERQCKRLQEDIEL